MGENTILTKVRNRRSSMAAMIMKLERTVFQRSFTEYQAIAKVFLLLLTLASLPGSVQQSPAFGGLGNLSPFTDYVGFYIGAVANPSVLSGLLDGYPLLALTSWSVASMFIFCLATSIREMVELDLISPRGPSAYRLQWLHSLRYLLASIFYPHRMRPCKPALEFVNYFGATRIRQSRLAVDSISGTRTIPDRSSCLSLTRRAVMNSFGYGGINAAVLQEKQIPKALSSIGTGSRKQISVGCPIPPTRNMDTNSLTSQFEDLLRTRLLNDLADRSQRRKESSEPLCHASLSTRSLLRSVSRSPTEQSNSLPAYSSLRNHPRIASPLQDPASLRFHNMLRLLSSRLNEYEKPPERNCHTITAGHSQDCSGIYSLLGTISRMDLAVPPRVRCYGWRGDLSSNKLQRDTILKPESMGTASRKCSVYDLGGYWSFTRYNDNMDASGQADLLQQNLTMLAYDAQPLPLNILGVLTEFDYCLRDVLDLLASHSKTIDRYSRLDLDHEVSSNSLRIIFQAGGILWSEAFIVLGISFEV